jgi:hypothetical protein
MFLIGCAVCAGACETARLVASTGQLLVASAGLHATYDRMQVGVPAAGRQIGPVEADSTANLQPLCVDDRSDGVWDTLDAVQNGTPRHFGLPHDTWEGLNPAEVKRIVPLVSSITQQPLGLTD